MNTNMNKRINNLSNLRTSIEATRINSIKDLITIIIEENKNGDKWFRGQADIEFSLLPSVIRDAYIIEDQYGRKVKPYPLKTFSTHGDKCMIPSGLYLSTFENLLKEYNLYDKNISFINFLCLAQHYGVKTPLLDWTTDAIVALFFALDKKEKGKSAGFYIFDPVKFNSINDYGNEIFNINNLPKPKYFPISFYGPKNDMRMCRQSGNFTLHGQLVWPIDYLYNAESFLKKIEIPDSVCIELKKILDGLGITKQSIYIKDDEKDKLAKIARDLNEKKFKEQLKKWEEEWEKDSEKGIQEHIYF